MAQRVAIALVDDLDDSEATVTVTFGLEGSTYEIDLNDQHTAELHGVLELYIAHGRRLGGKSRRSAATVVPRRRASPVPKPQPSNDPAVIRQWALDNGVAVSSRGRISSQVLEQYRASTK